MFLVLGIRSRTLQNARLYLRLKIFFSSNANIHFLNSIHGFSHPFVLWTLFVAWTLWTQATHILMFSPDYCIVSISLEECSLILCPKDNWLGCSMILFCMAQSLRTLKTRAMQDVETLMLSDTMGNSPGPWNSGLCVPCIYCEQWKYSEFQAYIMLK